MSATVLRIENLRKSYRSIKREVLSGLNMSIGKGEIYGFLGPNGAGKTTTVNILTGLLKEDSGVVEIFGEQASKGRKEVMRRVGVVPQSIALYSELTAYENLFFFGSVYGMSHREVAKRGDELLQMFRLEGFRDKKVGTFSGGMKRMVNLMVGILHTPDFLILDEPTVGIDVQSKVLILEILHCLNKEGMTILYTSHDMEEAQYLCTHVGIIDGGRLVAEDSLEGLIASCQGCNDLESVYLSLTGKKLRNRED